MAPLRVASCVLLAVLATPLHQARAADRQALNDAQSRFEREPVGREKRLTFRANIRHLGRKVPVRIQVRRDILGNMAFSLAASQGVDPHVLRDACAHLPRKLYRTADGIHYGVSVPSAVTRIARHLEARVDLRVPVQGDAFCAVSYYDRPGGRHVDPTPAPGARDWAGLFHAMAAKLMRPNGELLVTRDVGVVFP